MPCEECAVLTAGSAQKYVTLKVYTTGNQQAVNETKVLKHLDSIQSDHPGSKSVRKMLDTFEIDGTLGPHVCIVHEPLSLSLYDVRLAAGDKFREEILKPLLCELLVALDYLHSEVRVIHTGKSAIESQRVGS